MPECDYQLSEAIGDHRKGRGPLHLQKAEQGISGSVYEDLPGEAGRGQVGGCV